MTTYHVFHAPDGSDLSYCGERETLEEAQSWAETAPPSLEASMWDTARLAGHCAGMTAPPGRSE